MEKTEKEATQNRDNLKAVLKSGNLPVKINTVSVDQLSATLGKNYLYLVALAGFAAIILVSSVIFCQV